RSALVARLGGSKRRVGYARYARSFLLTDALDPVRDRDGQLTPSPILDAYNRLAQHVGCPYPGTRMELFTTLDDERRCNEIWEKTGLESRPEVICLNPGAAFGSSKHWPAAHFANLARSLAVERCCGVLVLCGPSETALCREIVDQSRHP